MIDEEPQITNVHVPKLSFMVVMTLLLQAVGVIIWATQLDARVTGMEEQSMSCAVLSEKFARLDERMENMKQDMDGIKHQLDRLTDRLLQP